MASREERRIREIDETLKQKRCLYEGIMQIFHQVDRKRRMLELDFKVLEKERTDLAQGQLMLESFNTLDF